MLEESSFKPDICDVCGKVKDEVQVLDFPSIGQLRVCSECGGEKDTSTNQDGSQSSFPSY